FICFGTEPRNLFELLPVDKFPRFITLFHNIVCYCFTQPCHMLQKRCRSSVYVNADLVNRCFYNKRQRSIQRFLFYIMLVLTNTNGFRINFYKLCKWILHPARDRCGTSFFYLSVRKFFTG